MGEGAVTGRRMPDQLAELYERVDWAATPLGDRAGWSPTLESTLRTVMATRFPSVLLWGEQFVLLYNPAYADLIGTKHPGALGRPTHEVFPEVWDQIGPALDRVRRTGEAWWVENSRLPLVRNGFLEECFFSYSYSAVTGPDDTVEGVLDVTVETTEQVQARRRLELLGELAEAIAAVETLEELSRAALTVLRNQVHELPVVDLRLPGVVTPGRRAGLPAGYRPDRSGLWLEYGATTASGSRSGVVAWQSLVGSTADHDRRLGIPVVAAGQALLVCELSPDIDLDASYRRFLRLVADSLTAAVVRVRALSAERVIAADDRAMSLELQNLLLASPFGSGHGADALGGLELATYYAPAVARERVGGDWYDAFPLPDGRVMIGVGDVAGHNRQAVAAMSQIRSLIRGIAYRSNGSGTPAAVLGHLDRALRDFGVDRVVTSVLAELTPAADGSGHLLRWASAGHVPLAVLHPDGTAELHEDGDIPLGVDADSPRTDHHLHLAPGCTALLYTDGLVERRRESIDLSLEHLRGQLSTAAELTPEALCDHLLRTLTPPGDDDVTLLAVRSPSERAIST